ncbi:MAG: PA0069 family radical SAM protein [Planktotalea sp.]
MFETCAKTDIQAERRKGRGAISNESGRFEAFSRIEIADDWDIPEERAKFRTEVRLETARSLISYNRSPDLPFDRSINPYRGCEHGCIYCFARPSHAYLGLSAGLDFETRLVAKPNAPELLEQELRADRYKVAPIAIGTNTDPYQPIEKTHEITRACLKVLARFQHPVAIVTKGTLIERDIDILEPMAAKGLVRVGISLTSLDARLARKMEPRVPSPTRKLQTIARLTEARIPVRVMASPIVPALNDPELEHILGAGKNAGAQTASWIMLRLPREVSPIFKDWLHEHYPDRSARVMARLREMHGGQDYDARWHHRMRGSGVYAELIAQRFRRACRALELDERAPPLRCDLFGVPLRRGDQMSLF